MSIQPNGLIFFKLPPSFVHTIDFLQHFFLFFLFPIAAVVFSALGARLLLDLSNMLYSLVSSPRKNW
jgi:hypothetical protein